MRADILNYNEQSRTGLIRLINDGDNNFFVEENGEKIPLKKYLKASSILIKNEYNIGFHILKNDTKINDFRNNSIKKKFDKLYLIYPTTNYENDFDFDKYYKSNKSRCKMVLLPINEDETEIIANIDSDNYIEFDESSLSSKPIKYYKAGRYMERDIYYNYEFSSYIVNK